MSTNITYQRVSTDKELHQILSLQKANLPQGLSKTEKNEEGFVTVDHSFDILKKMNDACPHIIAKDNNEVVGYALCMTKAFKSKIPVLVSMFDEIDMVIPNTKTYIVMGQICVSKMYRRKGVFRGLYACMNTALAHEFDCIVTEVDAKNERSLNAHRAIGFTHLKAYHSDDHDWELIVLDIK